MAPWTERLLTKIKKLYVVRLLLPADGQEAPVVSARVYGLDGGCLRSRQQQQHQQVLAESSKSFSNSHSQSVPDSSKTEGAGSSRGASKAASSAAAESGKPTADAETCLPMRSSDSGDGSSSTGSSGGGGGRASACPEAASAGRRRQTTPRLRISDSSQVTDAETAALHQFIARHMRRRTRRERGHRHHPPLSSSHCQPELAERRTQKSAAVEPATEVSVPASLALLPEPPQLLQAHQAVFAAVPFGNDLQIRGVGAGGEEGGSGGGASSLSRPASEELLVALLLNRAAGRPSPPSTPQPRTRAGLKFAAPTEAGSSSAERPRTGRRSRRPANTPDSGVTRTITFSVTKNARRRPALKQGRGGLEVKQGRRWLLPTNSNEASVEIPSPTTSSMTTTTSSTVNGTSVTVTASASPRRRHQRREQRRLGRGGGKEPGPFQPTFSRIVEWSEATDGSR